MQTLRKKTSPMKYKNETTRFLGDGVSFKAKLIGILEVSEARGDRMCQEALSDLKMAIRAAGEHKQRITINIAIDGLRLRDEKTGDSLYHHPVHKISFIAQDMTDSRAFGYIFGSPDTGHRFFGIKTDKAASQVVIAMRDLFQVVFALKKKEIELAKQHLEKTCYPSSPLFSDSSSSSSKSVPNVSIKSVADAKASSANDSKNSGTAVADLVDLELELNSLQQGLNQMERITPSDPFGSKDDPFGDSFISYPTKAILPPPPSSGKERASRTSESSSIFSPKTPHTGASMDTDKKKDFSFSHEFNSSHEEPSSGDWFTPSAGNSIFEDPSPLPSEPTKDDKHEQTKQEILSQFDVFTELDPLGTGRSKPYIDRKHFFQELKNPPKKALNDLVSTVIQEPPLFATNFNKKTPPKFTVDPFGEDPFVKEDPFADSDFSKQDPFDTEFSSFPANGPDKKDTLQNFIQTGLSKSPKSSVLESQISLSTSPKSISFSRQSTFDVQFNKLSHSHENPSLDVSSEGECAPEPPPRPTPNVMYIKPPPLPPKKQTNDLAVKPPPRPPYHAEESPYEFIDKYETAVNSVEFKEKGPPLPVPARKAKFDSEYPPERPRKHFNTSLSEEDYLTPISFLPPPQKSTKKPNAQVLSALESKSGVTSGEEGLGTSLDGLDITLSQLTLSGLNELACKLNIPPGQLSNMTLVQLTNFLSNFIKSSDHAPPATSKIETSTFAEFPPFQADFAANFENSNSATDPTYDRYAVFRELIQEEIKQTKIDSEPEEILEEKEKLENSANSNVSLDLNPLNEADPPVADRYAALREIVEIELKHSESDKEDVNRNRSGEIEDIAEEEEDASEANILNDEVSKETDNLNTINRENTLHVEGKEKESISPLETNIIEFMNGGEVEIITPIKSPVKSTLVKSPVPSVITEMVQNNTRLTSGSLSDVVSGSSPEVDNTASNSDVGKKTADATGESWAIFDQGTIPVESVTENQEKQSEEGVSPWSSDSKEFGNGSPPGWRSKDSGSGTEQYPKKRRDQEGWWDTSADPAVHYYSTNRRSTDSYDEEYYECCERPRRRRQQAGNWQHGGQATGGHSSSSRDVSPWEEEPRKREVKDPRTAYRYARGHSFERQRDRRLTDSWDEDDDYEYEEEHSRIQWSNRYRDPEMEGRHSTGSREHENDRWCDERSEDRRHRRRRDVRDRWCCSDWVETEHEKPPRYGSSRWTSSEPEHLKWRERKNDERYYSRESQESPWEDEYTNEPDNSPHYMSKRNWKRPSSASEMDRKTGEIKSRHHLGTGGSDGERGDRRYKPGRRSRSRDSQYSEPSQYRHKMELGPSMRTVHRNKPHVHSKMLEGEFAESSIKKSSEVKLDGGKKTSTLTRKKTKDSPKTEENVAGTVPRKSNSRGKLIFENDFVTDDGPVITPRTKFNFDNDFENSETESPIISRPIKTLRQQTMFEKSSPPVEKDFKDRQRGSSLRASKLSPRYPTKTKSHFEDDFSPSDKPEQPVEERIIQEEIDRENEDEFSASNLENATNGRKKMLSKNRLSGGARTDNLKKSESVNIFAREDDPFDDEFFFGEEPNQDQKPLPRSSELRWTDDFEN
ncbi:DAB adaptor protein isoform X3 [Leptinotarsa decemlineata]|uniref:DAB adaptor protein isoform X3 n=1 Tax=Leptinotarsa decemlineata TaxID=7539 RepID=UPI003D306489